VKTTTIVEHRLATADVPRLLYHATLEENVAGILREGLQPRSGNKKVPHPPRIYLVDNQYQAWKIARQLRWAIVDATHKRNLGQAMAILEIDLGKLPHQPPFWTDAYSVREGGLYTGRMIGPRAISVAEIVQEKALLVSTFRSEDRVRRDQRHPRTNPRRRQRDTGKPRTYRHVPPVRLPEDMAARYLALADAQRGEPEEAMLRVQFAHAGVLNPLVEHVGDINHRMNEWTAIANGDAGYEFVKPKVERSLRLLEEEYGFRREHTGNVANNARSLGMSLPGYQGRLRLKLREYAAAHAALPVYTRAQWLARKAAVAIGEERFESARAALRILRNHLGSREEWAEFAWLTKAPGGRAEASRGNPERVRRRSR
jgi:hypothetical protein